MQKVELMSPAGSFEALHAAIQGGADSVYFGVEQLNMRARATMNFEIDDLKEIATICNQHHVKSYLTLNTIVYDHDLALVKNIINAAKLAGITAVIASDQAVIHYASTQKMEVHISTQLNITNIETIQFYSHFADVMVLSRELSLGQIKNICDAIKKENIKGPSGNLIQIEVFAHGALCMAVSGKCYLSLHTQNASANRGACLQNCRRKYKVIDLEEGHELEIDNEYIMSPKDLCTIDFLNELIDTGISVLKIEGRGKAADYVKTVTQCYREAIDSYYEGTYTKEKTVAWLDRLKQVYNRDFWGGYFLGKELGEWTDTSGSKALTRKIYLGKGNHYYPKTGIAEFLIEAYSLNIGDKVAIISPTSGVTETTITSLHVNDEGAKQTANKGDLCAFPLDIAVRPSDKLYKIVEAAVEEKI
ncbi:putative protease YdcP precursor [mine drainage metagenome]|uniref:Putative protease YdcP n=1 Tax=mine drainage metagenome TaxID=410659 RepID=A0A1J5SW86_9ZZZZ